MLFHIRCVGVLIVIGSMAAPVHAHNGHVVSADSISDIVIDGDLSDWPARMQTHAISAVLELCDDTPSEDGFRGQYRVGYDPREKAIYVAVEIEDDTIVLDSIGEEGWSSRDACELFLSLDHSATRTSPVQFVYRGEPYATFEDAISDKFTKACKVARASVDNHILYEWRIDVSQLYDESVDLGNGAVIGFDVAYLDRDSEEEYAFYCSSLGYWKHMYSDSLGDLVIQPPNSKSSQIAGRALWSVPHRRAPALLRLQDKANEAVFFQFPLGNDGQFLATLPIGEYALSVVDSGEHSVPSAVQQISLVRDTLLAEPIRFEDGEPSVAMPVLLYDLAHGQSPVNQLEQLGDEIGYTVRMSEQPISLDVLSSVTGLYLLGPTEQFSEAEQRAVVAFVENGGSLLLVMDESRRTSVESTHVNDLVEAFGLKIAGDSEYIHNCGGIAQACAIHEHDLEIPFSGGRSVEGGIPFAFQLDRDGNRTRPFASYATTAGGGKVVVMGEAMASLFLGTPDGERLSGTPRNYHQTRYWGKDSRAFNADLLSWMLSVPQATTAEVDALSSR